MPTYHLHIEGQVQGVGFRPHVYRLARSRHLAGWVNNGPDGVHIEINCQHHEAAAFMEELTESHPPHSLITKRHLREVPFYPYVDFHIHESIREGSPEVLITPDVAMCASCKQELHDPKNRRYQYPFITCTDCGPRFSILQDLPYDRQATSMEAFKQCRPCLEEYTSDDHKRLHSQTNSCQACGPEYQLLSEELQDQEVVKERILQAWNTGLIVAIKGIGGYMLTCDARNSAAIQTLRERKNRPSKPFAVMFPDLGSLEEELVCPPAAIDLFTGPISPIVILPQKSPISTSLSTEEIAPGMNTIGAMIPYAPVFEWLLSEWKQPIIATSGNLTGTGILYQDESIAEELRDIADLIVTHNRDITFPQDDSVVALGQHADTRILMRRSRGIAPGVMIPSAFVSDTPMLAMGADLKAGFALNPHGKILASPFLGNLSYYQPQQTYRSMLENIQQIQQFDPELILIDQHPGYASSAMGREFSDIMGIPVELIQHHEAHFAALLGEHGRCESSDSILGFVWDGTGFSSDGQIWGGEVFSYQQGEFDRIHHLLPFPQLLGDQMSQQPRLAALSLNSCLEGGKADPLLEPLFEPQQWSLYHRLIQKEDQLKNSSMGRLFDAIGCLLLDKSVNTYEGEAAIQLEQLARRWKHAASLPSVEPYPISLKGVRLDWRPMLTAIIQDKTSQLPVEVVAYKFHFSLVDLIRQVGRQSGSQTWGFTGGVFQNSLLCDLIHQHLSEEAELLFHHAFPPNDEHIAFGQLIHHHITHTFSSVHSQSRIHVSGHTR